MNSIQTAHSIVGYNPLARPLGDFYPTPRNAVTGLLNSTSIPTEPIWEPACGDGAISRVLEETGRKVISTDLYDRGFGETGVDFLFEITPRANTIITNPPFNLAEKFLEHALLIGVNRIYFLLKLAFLEGVKRSFLLSRSPLESVLVFPKRLSMTRNGEPSKSSGMIAFAWFYWNTDYRGAPTLGWINEP